MTSNRRIVVGLVSLALAAGFGYAVRSARAAGIPASKALSYSGVLQDTNGPVTGMHNIQVTLYDAVTAGNQLCQVPSAPFTVASGRFTVQLPDACTTAVGANPSAWIDVVVDGADTGRTPIGAVPYAVEANHAVNATSATNATTATTLIDASAVSVRAAAAVSVPNVTFVALPFATVEWDALGEYNASTGFTPMYGGTYQICASVIWGDSSSNELDAFVNGNRFRAICGSDTYMCGGCVDVQLSAGQHATVSAYQSSGATQTVAVNGLWSYIDIHRVY